MSSPSPRAVIWDVDGTLVDSLECYRRAWREAMAEERTYVLTRERFESIICAEDVRRGKPDPEPFLMAAARMGIASERCIVVEDAAPGLEGARRAGMRTISVGPSYALLQADLVPTVDALPADTFDRLLPP